MGTNCTPLVAGLFLLCFCFVFRDTSCCLFLTIIKLMLKHLTLPQNTLDDLLNIDNPYFEQMVSQIYPTELQLNIRQSINTEAQLNRFVRVRSNVGFFKNGNQFLTSKLLKQICYLFY